MIAPLQGHEPSARDAGGHSAASVERHASVISRVHHKRRHADLRKQRRHIDLSGDFDETHGYVWRDADTLQFVMPVGLLLRRARYELRCEQLTECWIFLAPSEPHERQHG